MNRTLLTIYLVILFTQQTTLFSMDLNPVFTTKYRTTDQADISTGIDAIVNTIDGAITKKYAGKTSLFGNVREDDMIGIMHTVHDCSKAIILNNDFLDTLYSKNKYFKKAVDNFTQRASQDLKNVTSNTLKTIESQSTPQINTLPAPLRTYIMNRTRDQIKHEYTMTFLEDGDYIHCHTICLPTHQAAIGYNKKLCLFSLKTGKKLHEFHEGTIISGVCFNNNGSHLAAVISYQDIKVWCPQSKNLLYQIKQKDNIYRIDYNQETAEYVLSACVTRFLHDSPDSELNSAQISLGGENIARQEHIKLWLLTGNKAHLLGTTTACSSNLEHTNSITKEHYTLTSEILNSAKFTVTKKNCVPFYLCMQLATNTESIPELNKTIYSKTYIQDLTDYEKDMVNQELRSKINRLQKTLPNIQTQQQSQQNRPLMGYK